MKKVNRNAAFEAFCEGKKIYALTEITRQTPAEAFLAAQEYFIDEQPAEPSKPKKKVGQEPIPLNYDEITACRDAGMTYDAIGRKMHCSPSTIVNFLRREAQKRATEKGE